MTRAKPPKNPVSVGLPSENQFDLFKAQLPATSPKRKPKVIKWHRTPEPEILEPIRLDALTTATVAGSRETHAFGLYLRTHGLMLKALIAFAAFGALSIFVKAGVPILQVTLGPVLMPVDTFFFTGVLGLLNIIFGCATAWYAWRVVELSRLAGLPFHQTAAVQSRILVYVGGTALIAFAALCLFVTFADTLRLAHFLINNAILNPNGYGGWTQELKPAG